VGERLEWPDCLNVRELGGYDVGGRTSARRAIIRADNLNRLTSDGRAALVAYGVRTVIDLRDPREIERFPYPFTVSDVPAVTWRNVPLISQREWEAIRDPERRREGYVLTAKLSLANIAAALAAVADAPDGAVVLHCHAGKERTGIVAALLLALAGASDELIGADWAMSDDFLGPLYEQWVADEIDPEKRAARLDSFRSRPEHIVAVLDHMRRETGSVEAYLVAGGLTPRAIDRIRERFIA
jgi:protein tyrosine/serine phosphatase